MWVIYDLINEFTYIFITKLFHYFFIFLFKEIKRETERFKYTLILFNTIYMSLFYVRKHSIFCQHLSIIIN